MNASTFKPANRFLDRVTVAQGAVEWQGLSGAQQALVVVDDGLPFLAGLPELRERAEALLDAAQRGLITGLVQNEDGYPLRTEAMRLDRTSVAQFVAGVDARSIKPTAEDGEALLTEMEVRIALGQKGRPKGRSTINRWIAAGQFEDAHVTDPQRAWRKSYVEAFMSVGAKRGGRKSGSVKPEEDI
jgi:hypothetical protein